MSSITEIQPIEAVERTKELTFELVNRSKSQWVKKGQESSPNPQHMNSPKDYFVPMQSRVWDGSRYLNTQFVIGAPTIYVDDRQMAGKDGAIETVKGLRSLGYNLNEELRRSKNLEIKFTFGMLFLVKYGEDPLLHEFIASHEDNEERPYKEKSDPRKIRQFNFKPLRKEVKAADRISFMDEEIEATNYVGKLRTKTKDGYAYDKEMLNVLLTIFDEGVGLKDNDDNQKMEIIYRMAKHNGVAFMKIVNERMEEYKVSIAKANRYKILTVTSKEASITVGTKKRTLITFTTDNEAENINKMINYFIGNIKGKNDYDEMCSQIQSAIIAAQKGS